MSKILITLIVLLSFVACFEHALSAQTWTNTTNVNAFFDLPANWNPTGVPTPSSSVSFSDGTYEVWFDATTEINTPSVSQFFVSGLIGSDLDVTFLNKDSVSHTMTTNYLGISSSFPDTTDLTIRGLNFNISNGQILNSGSSLVIDGGHSAGTVLNVASTFSLIEGSKLEVNAGGVVNGHVSILRGLLTVDGAGSALNGTTASTTFGRFGDSFVDVTNGGVLNLNNLTTGSDSGSLTRMTIDGLGSQINAGNVTLGLDGDGLARVRNRGLLDADSIILGANGAGSGTIELTGTNSQLTTDYLRNGQGYGRVEVGAGSSATVDITTSVGGFGGGMTLSNGGIFTTDTLELRSGGLVEISGTGTLTTNRIVSAGGNLDFRAGLLRALDPDATFLMDATTLNGEPLNLFSLRRMEIAGQTILGEGAELGIQFDSDFSSNSMINNGTISALVSAEFGNNTRNDGYAGSGTLNVGFSQTTLHDLGLAQLGRLTTIAGGTLTASNGFSLRTGGTITGRGTIDGRIAAGIGSEIVANLNDLTLGDAGHVAGFSTGGELYTRDNTLTILDANQAQLGTYTQLGNIVGSGTLNVTNGAILDFGDNLVGYGTIDNQNTLATAIINNGAMIGDSITNRLIVEGYVKGLGTFENVQFNGTLAPGLSPTITRGSNFFFGGTSLLEMEIGGLIRGDEHDAIVASGLLSLNGTLRVLLFNGFEPLLGNSFDLFDWGSIEGSFHTFDLPTLNGGLRWDTSQLYSDGSLSVSAVPEPASGAVLLAAGTLISLRRRRV